MPSAAPGGKPRAGPNGEGRASALVRTPAPQQLAQRGVGGRTAAPTGSAEPTPYSTGIAFRLTFLGDLPALTGLVQAVA
jgi:hypothetical protein